MMKSTEHPSSSTPPPTDERVSIVTGDRMCATCHYNLIGQPVLREGHYNLLIIRCPECATVASVQEYPLLGKWSNRWAAALAGGWMFALMLLFAANGGVVLGPSGGMSAAVSEAYRPFLTQHIKDWYEAKGEDIQPGSINWNSQLFQSWWDAHDQGQVFQEYGGWLHLLWPAGALFLIPILLAALFGCLWSAILIHQRWQGRLLVGGVFALAWGSVAIIVNFTNQAYPPTMMYQVPWYQLGPPLFISSAGVMWIIQMTAMMLGRPVIRGLIRVFLPPRLRIPFSILWIADGKEPPTPKFLSRQEQVGE